MISINKERGFLAAAGIALVLTVAAGPESQFWFNRFLFGVPSWSAIIVATALGFACLRWLEVRRWRAMNSQFGQGAVLAATGALAFAAIVIAADLTLRFPADINAPWPWSLAFYPAMAFIAEVLFHLAPLALLAVAARTLSWRVIAVAALPEAVFQASQATGVALQAFVALHVFAFGAFGLVIFRRYGFVAMLTLRLCYYGLWHIGWGYMRLNW